MLGGVADDRDDDEAQERLREPHCRGDALDRVNQELGFQHHPAVAAAEDS